MTSGGQIQRSVGKRDFRAINYKTFSMAAWFLVKEAGDIFIYSEVKRNGRLSERGEGSRRERGSHVSSTYRFRWPRNNV